MTHTFRYHSARHAALAVAITLALLLGLGLIGQGSRAAAPADIPATVEIITNVSEVDSGDSYNALVRMTFTGAEGPVNGELNFNIGMPPSLTDRGTIYATVLDDQSKGIQTANLRREGNRFRWRGRFQAGGVVAIGVRVKTPVFYDPAEVQQNLQAEGMLAGSNETASANITVQVMRLAPLTGDDITITKRILTRNAEDDGWDEGVAALVGIRERVGLQIDVTNNTAAPIVALVNDSMDPENLEDEDGCFLRVLDVTHSGGRNVSLNPDSLREIFGDEDSLSLSLDIEPGETRTTTLEGGALSGIIDCMLSGRAGVRGIAATAVGEDDDTALAAATASAAVRPRLRLIHMLADAPIIESNLVTLTVVAPDLGDAPDSSNHFGAGMTAYPGTPAAFPTVFDAATGAPPGPRHRLAPPLHLGPQVSREKEADLNPNRNLDPPADLADLDTADDGVNLGALSLAACQPTPVAVAVSVNQRAVDYFDKTGGAAYLNVWLDGNRDGDWADSVNCGQQIGAGLEHIVINHSVDVKTLGAGLHTISVQSLPVFWPQPLSNRPAWLRVSLSDQPAPVGLNAGGVSHGDGRGPAAGYLLGETEDYLFVPDDAPAEFLVGPDMMVETAFTVEETAETGELGSQTRRGRQQLTSQVRYRNRGDRASFHTRVQVFTDPYLGMPTAAADRHDYIWCLTCTLASGVQAMNATAEPPAMPMHEVCDGEGNCHLEIDMMEVPVGRGGQKILRWDWLPEIGDEVLVTTRVVAAEDADDTYNETAQRIERPLRPIKILYPGDATINKNTFAARGLAEPGETLRIFSDGFESGDVSVDAEGRWSAEVTLPDGVNSLSAEYARPELAVQALPLETSAINTHCDPICPPLTATVLINSRLPWDPASFRVKRVAAPGAFSAQDSCPGEVGTSIRPADLMGRTDAEGWRLPVAALGLCNNETYEISVEVTCVGAEVNIVLGESDMRGLIDPDGDGVFTGQFKGTDEELQAALEVTCGTEQTVYAGEAAPTGLSFMIIDNRTGEPVAGANVYMITSNMDLWTFWPGEEYGQSNPQISNEQGQSIWQMPGSFSFRFRVYITHPDYQPYRSPAFKLTGGYIDRTIALTPKPDAEPDHRIDITAAGFGVTEQVVRRGRVVRLRNMDMVEHRATGADLSQLPQAQAASAIDIGLMAAGESVDLLFDQNGVYRFGDSENPLNQIIITVADMLYLPMMQR